jgi:hypothetical protein
MVHVPLMFLSDFGALPCAKENFITARVSMLLKSCASPDTLPLSLCNKKRLVIRHMKTPLSNDTIDPVLHRVLDRAKELSAPPRTVAVVGIHNLENNINTTLHYVWWWWCHSSMEMCLSTYLIYNFKIFNFNDGGHGDQYLKYVLANDALLL